MKKSNLKIAITGGIASGKSTVSQILKNLGYLVYSADEIYADLLTIPEVVINCSRLVGIEPLYQNNLLTFDRAKAKKIVFDNEQIRLRLNAYTHELVYKKIDEIFDIKGKDSPVFFEIPLLFESGRENDFDKVLVVLRSENDRLEALQKRDGRTREESEKIIKSQFDYNKLGDNKHTIIYNDGDIKLLEEKVRAVLESL